MLSALGRKKTARSAWEAVKERRVGVRRVREANAEQLRKEFSEITFKPGESVDDFSLRITGLASNISTLGGKIEEAEVVKRMLHVVPEHLEQVAISIETLLDVNDMSVEEVTGRLRAVEQRKKTQATTDKQGRLLLTEDEWLARLKIREAAGDGGSSSGGKGGRNRGRNRGRGRSGGNQAEQQEAQEPKKDRCLSCGKKGRWAKDCRSKPKGQAKAHMAEAEEDEPTLFMVSAGTVVNSKSIPSPSQRRRSTSPAPLDAAPPPPPPAPTYVVVST